MNQQEIERLKKMEKRVHEIAKEFGLLTTDIMFEIVPARRMIEAMAYHLPTNFSHWSFGRDFERQRTIYDHSGAGIPYEVVWNFETPRAFLVETNPFVLNVIILAHVYGHVDFYLGSSFMKKGREAADIAQEARSARQRFQKYEQKFGMGKLEKLIESAMALQWHQDLDPFAEEVEEEEIRKRLLELERAKLEPGKNADDYFRKPQTREETEAIEERLKELQRRDPPIPVYDLLGYILDHSPKPLRNWEYDVISTVRNQARHSSPNRRTKLLNEGWAAYWHVQIMRRLFEEGLLTDEEHGVYNDFHSGVLAKNRLRLNWYRVGLALYEDVKMRWDKGQFGREFEECKDPYKHARWDTHAGKGREKIFEMRSCFSDRMSIEALFSDEFIHAQELYIWAERLNPQTGEIEAVIVESRPWVIRRLLKSSHTLYGIPIIRVEDGNYRNNRELYLKHEFSGFELDPRFENGALEYVFLPWGRTVHLETVEVVAVDQQSQAIRTKQILHSYNGSRHNIEDFAEQDYMRLGLPE